MNKKTKRRAGIPCLLYSEGEATGFIHHETQANLNDLSPAAASWGSTGLSPRRAHSAPLSGRRGASMRQRANGPVQESDLALQGLFAFGRVEEGRNGPSKLAISGD